MAHRCGIGLGPGVIRNDFGWYLCNFELFFMYKIKIRPGMDMAVALICSHGIGIGTSLSKNILKLHTKFYTNNYLTN